MDALFSSLVYLELALDQAKIGSALIGGVAVAVWGEPRLTRDVDVKVAVSREEVACLLQILPSECRPVHGKPDETARQLGMVFLQDAAGSKIDLLLADRPFDLMAIDCARKMDIAPGIVARICTAEDLIVSKMLSTRPRDFDDVKGIVRRQGYGLDRPYVVRWLQNFELALDDSTLVSGFESLI